MSYILDALRRADAERQRGNVPGLHAPAVPAPGTDEATPRRVVPLAWVLAGAGLLLGGAMLAWLLTGDRPAEPTPKAAPPAEIAPRAGMPADPAPHLVAPPSATAPGVIEARPEAAPVVSEAPAVAAPGVVAPPPAAAMPAPNAAATMPTAPRAAAPSVMPRAAAPSSELPMPTATPASAATPGTHGAVATAPAAASRVVPLAELPEPLRRQLPAIALGGGVYAEQAAQRLVLVNGQVAREGDQLATDLLLVRILPRSVILSFRGQQFEMKL